jgi:glycine/D-amino acid oxidase-like deaminating enzyme/nitrite reductase/ring-hydroxylating ferredoxin subunit
MNVADERTKSVWMDTPVVEAAPLAGEQTADVAVIGGGIAGLSTAYELTARGRSVIVLDRGRIGCGMTARTTAHLASAWDDGYADLIRTRGLDLARLVYRSHASAIDRIEAIQAIEGIACDYQRLDGFLVLAPETPSGEIDEELAACQHAGVPVFDVREPALFPAANPTRALRFPDQGRFHPSKYLAGLARSIARRGGRLFADTTVESAVEEESGVVVKTAHGRVRATDVVFATNGPIGGSVTIHNKQAPYRTYALAARLPRGSLGDALYWDTLDPYHYVRLQPLTESHDLVIIGGEDHKSGEANDGETRLNALERWGRQRLPGLGEVTHRWSGQVMEPIDFVGFAGRNGRDRHRYIVTGDSGQGITHGVVAGLIISQLIIDGQSPWSEAYQPSRMITRNIGQFVSENLVALKSFAEYLTGGDLTRIEALRAGEGGIFRSGLKKIAACRDAGGQLHLKSATCTHMGCVVHWNSLEQCWDCRCHGSQFAPDGSALNGPAVAPLAAADEVKDKLVAAE